MGAARGVASRTMATEPTRAPYAVDVELTMMSDGRHWAVQVDFSVYL